MANQKLTVYMDCECGGQKCVEIRSPKIDDEVVSIHINAVNETRYTTAERTLILGRVSLKIPTCSDQCRKIQEKNDDRRENN